MERYIDMHCHILPGVDDGAASMEVTEKMLRIAYDEGIRCMIATPITIPAEDMSILTY